MREELQAFIYTEKLLEQLYRRAAALATLETERQAMLTAASNAAKNAEYLNYFYKQNFGVNFDPMVPDVVIQGGYREVINEILRLEIRSFLDLRKQTYNQSDIAYRDTIHAITDNKLGHILTLLAILTNLNTPQK